jgi:DNA-binding transcriptional ArsR family regulator
MTDIFAVLADRTRRDLLDALRAGEAPVGRLAAQVGLAQPAVSKHLRVLRIAGLVDVRSAAQHRYYRVRAEALAEAARWLEPYRALWADRLDALERHLDTEVGRATDDSDDSDVGRGPDDSMEER